MLGIIGAMDEEVAKLKSMISGLNIVTKAGMSFYTGSILDKSVVIVKCGVGKVNAAMCAQAMIDEFSVSAIINTGIAGSLDSAINIGDIVLATDTIEHDMDVEALGYGPGIIPDTATSVFKTDKRLLDCATRSIDKAGLDVKVFTGTVVSGDQFISKRDKKEWLVSTFGGLCTEMEGASIGHVATLNNIPYLVVRAISDKADDSAQMDYPTFAAMAIDNSVKMMTNIIDEYED